MAGPVRKRFVAWCALVGTIVPIVLMASELTTHSHWLYLELYYLLWPPSYLVLELYPIHGAPLPVALILVVVLMTLNGLLYAVVGFVLKALYGHLVAT